jgi:hypothetical protein
MLGRNPATHWGRHESQRKPAATVGLGLWTEARVYRAALIGHQKNTPPVRRRVEHVVVVVVVPSGRFAVEAAHLGDLLLGKWPDAVDIRAAQAVTEAGVSRTGAGQQRPHSCLFLFVSSHELA